MQQYFFWFVWWIGSNDSQMRMDMQSVSTRQPIKNNGPCPCPLCWCRTCQSPAPLWSLERLPIERANPLDQLCLTYEKEYPYRLWWYRPKGIKILCNGSTVLRTGSVEDFLVPLHSSHHNLSGYSFLLLLKPCSIETMVAMHCSDDGQQALCHLE